MRKTFFLLLLSFFSNFLLSQIPAGYYDSAIGKKKAELKTALHLKIMNANVLAYGGGDGKTWSGFVQTDVRPADGLVWDMYSNLRYSFNGNLAVAGMNIEHSFAKSWWGGTETQAYKDLHHLNPSDGTANQRKSSYMMSVIDSAVTYTNGVIKVGKTKKKPGMTLSAWEPADEYKGDFARVYMYMVTAYEDYAPLWTGDSENQLDNNTYPVFEPWAIDLLLQWSRQDPVSTKEINRNNVVYSIQGNRNPYIDFPEMAEYVWGDKITVPFTLNGVVDYPYLNYPDNNDTVDVGAAYLNYGCDILIPFKAVNLTGNISLAVSGTNASRFTTGTTSLTKADAENGCFISVHYSALTVGANKADLLISGGGIQPVTVHLKAFTSEAFAALPATGISSTGFTANWTAAPGATGYTIQLYSLVPTGAIKIDTILTQDFSVALPTSWVKEGYTELTSGTLRLASTGNPGKVSLQVTDTTATNYRLSVIAKQYGSDNGAKLTATVNNVSTAVWTTAVANQTFSVDFSAAVKPFTVALSAIAGKRVYIDYLNVQKLTPVMSRTYVSSYPKNVSAALSYHITGLLLDSTYYYTVTPIGVAGTESNAIKVHTDVSTQTTPESNNPMKYKCTQNGIRMENVPLGAVVNVYQLSGKKLYSTKAVQPDLDFPIKSKGIFIVQTIFNEQNIVKKMEVF